MALRFLLFAYLSAIVVNGHGGDGGACTEFQSSHSSWCVKHSNNSKICANIISEINNAKVCYSTPCKLEGKLNDLLFVALSDFSLIIIAMMIMITMYFVDCGLGQTTRSVDLRVIKIAVLIINLLVRGVSLWVIFDLHQAYSSLQNTGCIDERTITGWHLQNLLSFSLYECASASLFLFSYSSLNLCFETIVSWQIDWTKPHYKKLVQDVRVQYHMCLNWALCFDFFATLATRWVFFKAVWLAGSTLANANMRSGSDWCHNSSDVHHRGRIDQDTYTNDLTRLQWIVHIVGVLMLIAYIVFIIVGTKRMKRREPLLPLYRNKGRFLNLSRYK